jgi:hypothetical protein
VAAPRVTPGNTQQEVGIVLTIIEGASNVWMVITVDGDLRIYTRVDEDDGWSELSVSDDSEQVDPEKNFMLEELYARQSGEEEADDEGEPEGEEQVPEDEEELDEDGPELAEDEEPEDSKDEEPEEEKKPRRRRAASASRGARTAASRK